jgi:hypothetical protein
MVGQLKAFKQEHGHTQVPAKPFTPLRKWILRQRKHYVDSKQGLPTPLNTLRHNPYRHGFFKLQTSSIEEFIIETRLKKSSMK